ncbi:hypothetical protein OAG06_01990 [Verrucomicrobia bacterium]|nr:hypothetical protein [Verrucomicrobiota bacterium]
MKQDASFPSPNDVRLGFGVKMPAFLDVLAELMVHARLRGEIIAEFVDLVVLLDKAILEGFELRSGHGGGALQLLVFLLGNGTAFAQHFKKLDQRSA